jgi:hypothetical protein
MKKILNTPANFVPEMLDGLVNAYPYQKQGQKISIVLFALIPRYMAMWHWYWLWIWSFTSFPGYVGKGMLGWLCSL